MIIRNKNNIANLFKHLFKIYKFSINYFQELIKPHNNLIKAGDT